ncbi:MAG: type II toxin-antitoxin system VapC family toxin [Novosphingobium sp.]
MILDSNVLIDLLDPDAPEAVRSGVMKLAEQHEMRVNEIVFSEIAHAYKDASEVSQMLDAIGITLVRLTLPECHLAGKAFAEYRRRGGERTTILPDFLIGAQAASRGWPLVTRDRRGFASYFPEIEIIDPMQVPND